jgi:hypothetical protein
MSRLRVLCTGGALAIAGYIATAQTPMTSLLQITDKVIPAGRLSGPGDAPSLTGASSLNGGQLAGTWEIDRRDVDSVLFLDMGAPTLFLSPVGGTNLNGDWHLFLSDLDFGTPGNTAKWDVIVTAVPEPSTWALIGVAALVLGIRPLIQKFVG